MVQYASFSSGQVVHNTASDDCGHHGTPTGRLPLGCSLLKNSIGRLKKFEFWIVVWDLLDFRLADIV
ncbi:hypothetical protein T03_15776 [Trichinella britovi]|uniref:Uncharacterized protein n=1 Tax=Trichinella britovi TaxID=45882 RepID=A0A0V1CNC9_TRIBR|nr:hypothetical protein T03_15776 [Trichinella britovi]